MPTLHTIQLPAAPKAIFLAGTEPPRPTFSEAELEIARHEAYQRGAEETRLLLEGQMLEMRTEVLRLQDETFAALAAQHTALAEEFFALLPKWTLAATQRVLGSMTLDGAAIRQLVGDLLQQVDAGREAVEVRLHEQDLRAITEFDAQFRERHPAISFTSDATLQPGDCLVRSRFGTLDGRLQTKLSALEEALHE